MLGLIEIVKYGIKNIDFDNFIIVFDDTYILIKEIIIYIANKSI